jgi:uncharacterized membrane protein (DUF485 family)
MARSVPRNPLRPFIPDAFFSIFAEIAAAWITGSRTGRCAIGTGLSSVVAAFLIRLLVNYGVIGKSWNLAFEIAVGLAVLMFVLVVVYRNAERNAEAAAQIEEVEQRAREHPDQPRAAWDLARIKLESYLDRNLLQVSWIYFLVLLIMVAGFVLVGLGIWHVYAAPDNFKPSVLAAVSGVVVQFIGATFLLIYKSTMEQARDYVTVLERINAVGMSIQILESIEGAEPQMRNDARSQIARDLLRMYGTTARTTTRSSRLQPSTRRRRNG